MDINLKRKLQNRGAQRAFRERKEKHLADLEARVVEQAEQLEAFRTLCERLHAENHALRRGEAVPSTELPSATPSVATDSAAPLPAASEAPPAVDLTLPPLPPPSQPFTFQSLPQPLPQPAPLNAGTTPFPPIPTYEMAPSNSLPPPTQSTVRPNTPLDVDMLNMDMNFDFDFDAPVDLDAAVPLPPFLQDLFDSFGDGGMGVGTAGALMSGEKVAVPQIVAPRKYDTEVEEGDDVCPGDEDDVAPLTAENMPCPECDFSVVRCVVARISCSCSQAHPPSLPHSCALPLPWRPPTIGKDVASKDVWVSQKAWAKLCSHPLFSQCDVVRLLHPFSVVPPSRVADSPPPLAIRTSSAPSCATTRVARTTAGSSSPRRMSVRCSGAFQRERE